MLNLRPLATLTLPALALLFPFATSGFWDGAISVGSDKQLFIDHKFIEASDGVTLSMNPPYQTRERLVVADQPWEEGSLIASYCSILKEDGPEGPRIRLWYDLVSGGGLPGNGYRAVAYAESRDGIHFHKPILNLVEKDGSTRNNLVMPTDLSQMTVGGGSVAIDENPDCPPGQRYKSWTKVYLAAAVEEDGVDYGGGHRLWYSADGLRWRLHDTVPTGLRAADTQPTWFWDPRINRYVGYSREWVEWEVPGDPAAPRPRTRMIGYNESDDMLRWDSLQIAIGADPLDLGATGTWQRLTGALRPVLRHGTERVSKWGQVAASLPDSDESLRPGLDFYGPGIFKYSEAKGVYFGLISAFYHWTPEMWPSTTDAQLVASRDGRHFRRLGDRRPFLRLGPEGSFDSSWLWFAPQPIRMGDEIWIYYVGSTRQHEPVGDTRPPASALSRAVMRLDGFVSADADYSGGWLTTPPLVFEGDHLELNLDTSAGGVARIEIQEADGSPIPGYSWQESRELNGNSVRMKAGWLAKGSDVSSLAGRPVRLHLRLRDCKLYAFQFVESPGR